MYNGTSVQLARKIRQHSLRMANKAHTSHVGSCLSCADILAVLYGEVMQYRTENPTWDSRDRFILSKGHAGAALSATLAECGFFPTSALDYHCQSASALLGHVSHLVPGVEVSTGSLGHGLPISCGMALAAKGIVYVLLSDGDLNEGSTWEAAMFASHHKISNLVAIIDYNQLQALGHSMHVLDLKPITDKWKAFGWDTWMLDGHSHYQLSKALLSPSTGRPKCLIAFTTKGKGVSFMENKVEWHYKSPTDEELRIALEKLEV